MNNNGIYGGDRRQQELKAAADKGATAAGFGADPVPTSFVPDTRQGPAPKPKPNAFLSYSEQRDSCISLQESDLNQIFIRF